MRLPAADRPRVPGRPSRCSTRRSAAGCWPPTTARSTRGCWPRRCSARPQRARAPGWSAQPVAEISCADGRAQPAARLADGTHGHGAPGRAGGGLAVGRAGRAAAGRRAAGPAGQGPDPPAAADGRDGRPGCRPACCGAPCAARPRRPASTWCRGTTASWWSARPRRSWARTRRSPRAASGSCCATRGRWCPASPSSSWPQCVAGLRPGTPDNAPVIGPGALPGLVLATGHFRAGVLLAPVTADTVAALPASPGRLTRAGRPFAPAGSRSGGRRRPDPAAARPATQRRSEAATHGGHHQR